MSCKSIPEQTAVALQATSAQDSDTFTFTRNMQLYGITFSGLKSSLGVTGQIKSTGLGVALLSQPSSTLNYIAALSAGDGISITTAPDGAVKIASGLTNAAVTGAQVLKTGGVLRRLKAGGAVTVTENTDDITISIPSGSAILGLNKFKFIQSKSDFPAAVGGVITLDANTVYFLTEAIDLSGDRIAAGVNTVIAGSSSETASLTSTGIGTAYLITTSSTLVMYDITIKNVTNAISVNPSNTGSGIALDWRAVNFSGCTINARFGNIGNFIYDTSAVLGSGKFEFFGSVDTIAINNSLLTGNGSAYSIIDIQSTAIINRRFRVIYSSFVATGSTVAINVDVGATLPNETYILDTCNFAGGGTYLTGVTATSNKALFVNNVGIANSSDISQYYMNGNATATVISATSTPVKVAGTTTSSAVTSKFTNTANRATYVGALNRFFKATATASLTSGNGNQVGMYFAKNGVVLPESEIYATTSGTGSAENIVVQTLVSLMDGDYLEVFVENNTAANNITVTDLNVVIN